MLITSRTIAVLTAVAALSSTAGASALAKTHGPASSSHATVVTPRTASKAKGGGGVVKPVKVSGTVVALISAFPAGGRSTPTSATRSTRVAR